MPLPHVNYENKLQHQSDPAHWHLDVTSCNSNTKIHVSLAHMINRAREPKSRSATMQLLAFGRISDRSAGASLFPISGIFVLSHFLICKIDRSRSIESRRFPGGAPSTDTTPRIRCAHKMVAEHSVHAPPRTSHPPPHPNKFVPPRQQGNNPMVNTAGNTHTAHAAPPTHVHQGTHTHRQYGRARHQRQNNASHDPLTLPIEPIPQATYVRR